MPTRPADEPPAAGPPVCQLLTTADVSRIAGLPATVDEVRTTEASCFWSVGDPDDVIPAYFVSFRRQGGDLASARLAFAGGQDVADIGEGGYWAPGVTALWFQHRGVVYAVQFVLLGEDDGDALAIAREMAERVISRP